MSWIIRWFYEEKEREKKAATRTNTQTQTLFMHSVQFSSHSNISWMTIKQQCTVIATLDRVVSNWSSTKSTSIWQTIPKVQIGQIHMCAIFSRIIVITLCHMHAVHIHIFLLLKALFVYLQCMVYFLLFCFCLNATNVSEPLIRVGVRMNP